MLHLRHMGGTRTSRAASSRAAGFTLIELLVVIAIIGLLASIILASLNSARAKGRDARRLADLKEIANVMALTDNGASPVTLVGCTAADSNVSKCTTPNLSAYKDPSGATAACGTSNTSSCDYAIGSQSSVMAGNPTTQNFEVCAYLETASGPLTSPGMVSITSNGTVVAGCN